MSRGGVFDRVARAQFIIEDAAMQRSGNILVLWNQVEEDIYEHWREQGPRPLPWDPARSVPDVGTVAEEMDTMMSAIRSCGYTARIVNIEDDLDRLISSIRLYRPDLIINLIEFFNDDSDQESFVAGLYDMLRTQYTGNRPITLATCQNKYRTKLILEAHELPTSPYILVEQEPVPTDHQLVFPLIVKPSLEDASGGIEPSSVVHDQAELEAQVRRVLKEYKMPILIEEYVDGREIHAAILGNESPEVLPLFEMEFDDSEFNPEGEWRPQIISYRAKWDPHSPEFYTMDSVCPAQELEEELEEYIRDVARQAYQIMGCRDYARIDMRIDEEEGEVYILEVNPNPDLSDGAAYMQCAKASGRTFAQTLQEIIEMGLERHRAALRKRASKPALPSDHLMREWVVSKSSGAHTTLPLSGPVVPETSSAASNAPADTRLDTAHAAAEQEP